jgi:uncharacterized repeat protein (TIGR01451 family)
LTVPTIAPGQTLHFTFAVVAADPLPPGVTQVTNSACASLFVATEAAQRGLAGDTSCSQATTPLSVALKATLSADLAFDSNHNSFPEANDVLLYTLIVSNPSAGSAQNVQISIPALDPRLQLLADSIVTTAGTVSHPQAATDPVVTVSSLAPGASVTVTFRAQVVALPRSLRFLSTQGSVSGANITTLLTDDPGTPEPNDPTLTPLRPQGPAIQDVPTLSGFSLVVLAFALAGATLIFLRRRDAAPVNAGR